MFMYHTKFQTNRLHSLHTIICTHTDEEVHENDGTISQDTTNGDSYCFLECDVM